MLDLVTTVDNWESAQAKASGPHKNCVERMSEMTTNPRLIGRAGELLVAAELMRRGVEVAQPASDVGVDLLAYRLESGQRTAGAFVPIQVKAYSKTGYKFLKAWFERAPGLALVQVWHVATTPQFYVFADLKAAIEAIGDHAKTPSWATRGVWSNTNPSDPDTALMVAHRDRWDRIIDQLHRPSGPG